MASFFETVLSPVSVNSTDLSTLAVDVRRFPWIRRLVADYAYDFTSISPFFSGNPSDPAAWAQIVARTQAHARRRVEIAGIVANQQRRRGAPAAAQAAAQDARKLAQEPPPERVPRELQEPQRDDVGLTDHLVDNTSN